MQGIEAMKDYSSQVEELLKQIESKPNIEKVIDHLKSLNFEFVDVPLIEKLETRVEFNPKWVRNYSFLVRRYTEGDKSRLDFRFMIGIRFIGVRLPKYLIFRGFKYRETVLKPWQKPHEFNSKKKKVLLVFPKELDIEERKVWRYLHSKFQRKKPIDPDKLAWYLKYKPMIQNLDKEFDHLD